MPVHLALPGIRNPLWRTLLVGPRSGLNSLVPKLGDALHMVGLKKRACWCWTTLYYAEHDRHCHLYRRSVLLPIGWLLLYQPAISYPKKATLGGKTDGFRVKRPVFCFSRRPSDVAADEEQVRVELAAVVVAEQRQGRLEARTASFSRKLVRVRTYSTQAKPKWPTRFPGIRPGRVTFYKRAT